MQIKLSQLRKIIRETIEEEKNKLDPVGHEDKDINNDGKVDDTDDYLLNRREKISASMKESRIRRSTNMLEAYSRITEEEMAAWKNGDWGYVSGDVSMPEEDHQKFLHGSDSGHPVDDEGYMVKSRMTSMKQMAEDVCGLLDSDDQLPGWVQDLVATSHNDLKHVHDYLMGDEKLRDHKKSQGK